MFTFKKHNTHKMNLFCDIGVVYCRTNPPHVIILYHMFCQILGYVLGWRHLDTADCQTIECTLEGDRIGYNTLNSMVRDSVCWNSLLLPEVSTHLNRCMSICNIHEWITKYKCVSVSKYASVTVAVNERMYIGASFTNRDKQNHQWFKGVDE